MDGHCFGCVTKGTEQCTLLKAIKSYDGSMSWYKKTGDGIAVSFEEDILSIDIRHDSDSTSFDDDEMAWLVTLSKVSERIRQ